MNDAFIVSEWVRKWVNRKEWIMPALWLNEWMKLVWKNERKCGWRMRWMNYFDAQQFNLAWVIKNKLTFEIKMIR